MNVRKAKCKIRFFFSCLSLILIISNSNQLQLQLPKASIEQNDNNKTKDHKAALLEMAQPKNKVLLSLLCKQRFFILLKVTKI